MQTIQVQLPDTVNIDAQEIQMLLAGKLYEKGLLSIGQAAQMAGFTKRAFMELLPETCPGDQGRASHFISATQPEALPILNRTLMSLIKAKKHRTANDVIDGLVIWRCKGEKT